MITTKFFHNHDQLSETMVEGAKHWLGRQGFHLRSLLVVAE